jgi:type I restriction enzyme S subunit
MMGRFKQTALGQLAIFEMGQSPPSAVVSEKEESGIPFLQGNAEFGPIYPEATKYCSSPKKLCEPGDVLISVRAPVGALNKADRTYVIGRGLAAIRFTGVQVDFGWHMINYWAWDLHQVAQGSTFKAVSKDDLNTLSVLVPPPPKQRRIAEILDAADEAIRQTERVIAKLREVKRGLLHDLLTRGLDADGNLRDPVAHPEQFKDSSLGRIPREWEARSLDSCVGTRITYGIVQAGPHIRDGVPYIRTGDITDGQLTLEGLLRTSEEIAASYKRSEVHTGEIVCAIRATVGEVVQVPPELDGANLTQGTARIAPIPAINNRFLLWALRSDVSQRQFDMAVKGTTFREITLGALRKLEVALPEKREEQDKLVAVLDVHDARIRAEEAVLAKRRQVKRGLMEDLLTGRVRV